MNLLEFCLVNVVAKYKTNERLIHVCFFGMNTVA